MVNREKHHGFYPKLKKYLNYSIESIGNIPLINLRDYVKKNIPEVYNEMINNPRYVEWLAEDCTTNLIKILTFNNKKVGFAAYDMASIKSICLGKVYILEKYRGNGILGDHLWELSEIRFKNLEKTRDNDFILTISEPNLYTIKSLIKSKIIIPLPHLPTLYMGLFSFFTIKLGKHGDNSIGKITPFYSLELGSPVGVVEDTLVYSGMSFIDDEDFNISVSRNEFLNNPKKMEDLKEAIQMLTNELGELALAEVGDCSGLYDRKGGKPYGV